MPRPKGLTLSREHDSLRAVMRPGRNPYYYVGALVFGVPWLATVVVGVVYALRNLPASDVGLLWAAALLGTFALTVLLDVLALALIWLSAYALFGTETVEITDSEILVKRRTLGVTMHAKAQRGHFDRVTRLDPRRMPGRVPHPRVEISGAHARLRVGSGLTETEAAALVDAVREFIRGSGPQQVEQGPR